MRSARDDTFSYEATTYRLCFTCERCVHFDPGVERCAHEYPTDEHREADCQSRSPFVVFCKEYELF